MKRERKMAVASLSTICIEPTTVVFSFILHRHIYIHIYTAVLNDIACYYNVSATKSDEGDVYMCECTLVLFCVEVCVFRVS